LFRASRDWRTFARVAGLRDIAGSRPATAFTLFAVRRAAVPVWDFFFALRAITILRHRRAPCQGISWPDHGAAHMLRAGIGRRLSTDIAEEQLPPHTVPVEHARTAASPMEPGRSSAIVPSRRRPPTMNNEAAAHRDKEVT
jgi:hypothetical protein